MSEVETGRERGWEREMEIAGAIYRLTDRQRGRDR